MNYDINKLSVVPIEASFGNNLETLALFSREGLPFHTGNMRSSSRVSRSHFREVHRVDCDDEGLRSSQPEKKLRGRFLSCYNPHQPKSNQDGHLAKVSLGY